MTEFTEISQIGAGSFGRVFKSRNKLDKFEYAIKKINIKNKSSCAKEKAIQEALTLAQSSVLDDNSYIIKYYSAWIEKSTLYLVMELCDCSLPEYLERTGTLDEVSLIKIFRDLCKGLKKLHNQQIVHLDIKPENILFSFNHRFKIADLGLARITTNLCGEIPEGDSRYLAPELMKIMQNDPDSIPDLAKADIFSLGCTILEIMNGEPLPNNGPLWQLLRDGEFEIKGEYSQFIKEIVRKMMNKNPENRPSAEEILGKLLSRNKQKAKDNENYIRFLENALACKENKTEIGDPVKRRKFSV
jgi:wee1-like protein kinase